ncbi:MAG: LytR/AlgR family response regulator transcription factor [Brevundimonas sp.]|uniref:LytR/AlgR family response regulator transcription factor n=1 Tax=Brevundimonas sp. TaxID=1871086 RepID=UPI004033C269
MGVGERSRLIVLVLAVAGLVALCGPQIAAMLSPAPARTPTQVWSLCPAPDLCRPVDVSNLALDAPINTLTTTFVAGPDDHAAPLALHIAATASAEIRWNGALIGTNGQVGADRAQETPGRFSALVVIPQDRVRPGPNRVEVRLSAHHLWAPVRRPIHDLSIGPYSDPLHGTLRHYLPTLLLTGLLALAFLGAAGLWLARRPPGSATLTLLTGAVLAQAVAEASKLALTYSYPWQLARLAAVAGMAAVAALALGRLAQVFVPERRLRWGLTAALVFALLIALLGPPWWDAKALWSYRAGCAAALIAVTLGALSTVRYAQTAQAVCVLALALSWSPDFLDISYYLLFLTLFGGLAAYAVLRSRAAAVRPSPEPPPGRNETLSIPDGTSRRLIRAEDLLHVRAADDYSLVTLTDGREVLSTANLSTLTQLASAHLVRIHRSHAVNPAWISAVHRSGRSGPTVELKDGVRLPIGRAYRAALDDERIA